MMRNVMSFFGGKWTLARDYGPPRRDIVVEPFAGGAGYSLYWEPRRVILVEKDPVLWGVWDYIQRAPAEEIRSLPLVGEFETLDDVSLPTDAKALIGMWLGCSLWSPRVKPTPWVRKHLASGCRGSVWSERTRERVASQQEKIKRWTIILGDYSEAPDVDAHWHIDPPYQVKGRSYVCRDVDYTELAQWCQSRRGFVQVCENTGAEWLPFRHMRDAKSINDRLGKGARSSEVVWERGQPDGG